jgi:hypothetical protein
MENLHNKNSENPNQNITKEEEMLQILTRIFGTLAPAIFQALSSNLNNQEKLKLAQYLVDENLLHKKDENTENNLLIDIPEQRLDFLSKKEISKNIVRRATNSFQLIKDSPLYSLLNITRNDELFHSLVYKRGCSKSEVEGMLKNLLNKENNSRGLNRQNFCKILSSPCLSQKINFPANNPFITQQLLALSYPKKTN